MKYLNNIESIKKRWCSALWKAYMEVKPVDSPASTIGELSVEQAYDVQAMLIENKICNGERIIGWKVGATSQAVMDQLQGEIGEPIFGCMTSKSCYPYLKGVKASDFCRLAIEGEIAFIMQRPLRGPGITNADVIMATSGVMASVELVDSRIKDWNASIPEIIADNSFHAGVILGPFTRPISALDLRHEGVVLSKNGRLLASACGCEALNNPVNVVTWLANKLSQFDREIQAGEVIMTGSLTKFFFVEPGDVVDVSYSNLGSIQFAIQD